MRKLKLSRAFTALLATALTLGAGGANAHANAPTTVGVQPSTATQDSQQCPPGGGYMGCAIARPSPGSPLFSLPPVAAPAGCKIPDVSSYQGHPNWQAAKAAGICGAIFKAGEYTTDTDALYNSQTLTALHIWHAIYWFVRNTGCSHEAAQIIAAAHTYHVLVVANDLETPEASGYAACLVPAEKKAGLIPVNYTAPGTWPGGAGKGNAPLWQAEYGSTLHPFWTPVVAWQCTDGHFGCVTNIPGIGQDDVSIDMGITKLGGSPPKPAPQSASLLKTVFSFGYGITASEQDTYKAWSGAHCANPPKRPTCETAHYHAQLLRDRLLWEVKHGKPAGWQPFARNSRYHILNQIVGG